MSSMDIIPRWLQVLVNEKFFSSCLVHESQKKNDENSFCLDCSLALCLHCLPSHKTHFLLRIRRYMYQDVLRLKDAEKLMECSFIQPYTTNSAKVLFLKQRPNSRSKMKSSVNSCIICQQNLQNPYLFCSIFCKVNYIVKHSRELKLNEDDHNPLVTSSNSTDSDKSKVVSVQSIKMEGSSGNSAMPVWSECASSTSRRKNIPRRSPFF